MTEPKREGKVAVFVRLPAGLVALLDRAALADAEAGFAPSRARTLVKVLPEALRNIAEKPESEVRP